MDTDVFLNNNKMNLKKFKKENGSLFQTTGWESVLFSKMANKTLCATPVEWEIENKH